MGKSIAATLMGQLIHEAFMTFGRRRRWTMAAADFHGPIRMPICCACRAGAFLRSQDPDTSRAGYPTPLHLHRAIDSVRWASRARRWPPNTVVLTEFHPLLELLIRRQCCTPSDIFVSAAALFDRLGIRNMLWGRMRATCFWVMTGIERDGSPGLLYLLTCLERRTAAARVWADSFVRRHRHGRSRYGGFFWLNRTGRWPVPEDAYFMAGAGGQYTIIIPTHDLVVVRLGHYKGAEAGEKSLRRALELLMAAVPQVRDPWQPPSGGR